jgi:hypothetical protein
MSDGVVARVDKKARDPNRPFYSDDEEEEDEEKAEQKRVEEEMAQEAYDTLNFTLLIPTLLQ